MESPKSVAEYVPITVEFTYVDLRVYATSQKLTGLQRWA